MATVAIQYGIFGGQQRGRRMVQALKNAGYQIVRTAHDADIVIAHSAGCFWLPPQSDKQKLLLIDPPYWPDKSIKQRSKARTKSNRQFKRFSYPFGYWLAHNAWGIVYGLKRPVWHIKVARYASSYDLPSAIKGRKLLLVRNEHDDWLTPNFEALKKDNPDLQTVTLPGDHEDCWFNPQSYVALLKDLP